MCFSVWITEAYEYDGGVVIMLLLCYDKQN